MVLIKFAKYLIYCVISSVFLSLIESNESLNLKYVLIWTPITTDPIKYLDEGMNTFIERRCFFTNCYVSSNRQLLKLTDFDVILFHGPELKVNPSFLPWSRSPHQKYVFASMESSAYFPVCNKMFNNYFNWTYTYKLDSDEIYGYMTITDKKRKVIGPKKEMHWKKVETMMPIKDKLKAKLRKKKIAAAWFVSHCQAPSGRDLIAQQLKTELAKYNMQVDIIGECGTKKCPRSSMKECLRKLETDYYFYLSFENSFAEDYVTEKLLHALNHYTVPVVYGGANYTRFMPDGIYLTAQKSRIKQLAKQMVDIITNKQKYYKFFKWHNHYSYNEILAPSDSDKYCRFCALINNEEKMSRKSVYKDFRKWWNPKHYECH